MVFQIHISLTMSQLKTNERYDGAQPLHEMLKDDILEEKSTSYAPS